MRKRNILLIALAFVIGMSIGFLAYGILLRRTLPIHDRVVTAAWIVSERFRATRSEREGQLLKAIVHRWNAVDYCTADSIYEDGSPSIFYPFELLALESKLERIQAGTPELPPGTDPVHSIELGQLAWLLDEYGASEEAHTCWSRSVSQDPTPESVEEKRESIESMRRLFNTPLHLEAEKALLDRSPR